MRATVSFLHVQLRAPAIMRLMDEIGMVLFVMPLLTNLLTVILINMLILWDYLQKRIDNYQ
jgi:hypothetical protein